MTRQLLTNIDVLATFDDARREIRDGAILLDDDAIVRVGTAAELADASADVTRNLSGHVVLPGFVNTHHHFYQNLTRVMGQDVDLFSWLRALYPVWARIDDAALATASRMAMAELIASGCTTTSDHLYILPNDCRIDTTIAVASEMGLRFHATRGAMSRGESAGGLPPDSCVEKEDAILADAERLIATYHDMRPRAMTRIALAPCSPFSVTPTLLRETAALARRHPGVRLHAHLAEVIDEIEYCEAVYGMRPVAFAESVGWLGPDVWFAHTIFLNDAEIAAFAASGTGATYCPAAHMRCGLGIMRAREMLDAGVRIGIGVDGSASNDTSNLLAELRLAMLLQRVAPERWSTPTPGRGNFAGTPTAMAAREVLFMATRGGAALLGRDDIGQIAPGMAADIIAFDRNCLGWAGTERDPLAALVLCGPFVPALSLVNGVPLIEDGAFTRFEPGAALEAHRQTVARIYDL